MATKLHVQFSERQSKTLEEMAEDLGTSKAGALKAALALLELALRERKRGNALGVVRGDREVREIIGLE